MQTFAIRRTTLVLTLCLTGWFAGAASAARVVVPEGTVLSVTMDSTLSSATNRVGDRFTASVNANVDIPEGSKVEGSVRAVQRAGNGNPGTIDVNFDTMRFPGGQRNAIAGSLISLDDKRVTQSNGRLMARTKKSNRDRFIAYGAGAGLVIGVLTKSNIITGTVLGAAAGWVFNELNRKKASPTDVTVSPGTEFGVRLDTALVYNTTTATTLSSARGIRIMMDRREVAFGADEPIMERGHVFAPLGPIMEEAGVDYHFDSARNVIRIERDDMFIYHKIGQSYALVDGERHYLDVAAQLRGGEVYVPIGLVELATGKTASWDSRTRIVSLLTPRIASR